MKILHLIDSLNAGGAERMAVSYANALAARGGSVFLWSTREEGLLKETISPQVHYRFLNRQGPIGLRALFNATQLIKEEKIQLIHAHSTSWFFGTLLKGLNPSVKLIWHDHYGSRTQTTKRSNKTLVLCSSYFDKVVAVNKELVQWHQTYLRNVQSVYLPNFVSYPEAIRVPDSGSGSTKTIVCMANLRPPKNHENLIQAFSLLQPEAPDWKLLLIGKVLNDAYSDRVQNLITDKSLSDAVVVLGERADVFELLQQAEIGVLSSDMEGLPMTLLEYARSGLAVVTTDVGDCREVVQDFGKVVPPNTPEALAKALLEYIQQPEQRLQDAGQLQAHIKAHYTEEAVLPQVIKLYENLIG
ncbi:glycosyltransferase [Planktosalinus lacus]|uniref:Glycosyl transferase n=1 Tax=Planktosalinus lacus TaxID=1526573 RepID=A0A8J2V7C0_9FLAO|nr:glycosyltransferase [Planktosalinus lacus]GGD84684.1 glycosyl transferase [Planktosalinus lacus]